MAIFRIATESGGHPLKSATIKVYTENSSVSQGSEEGGFSDADLATIYSDRAMTTAIDQATSPLTSDSLGEAKWYAPNGSLFAVRISRSGYGAKWYRDVEMLGSDPL